MDMATRVQVLDEADCISLLPTTLATGMNPNILPPVMEYTGFFSLGGTTSLNSNQSPEMDMVTRVQVHLSVNKHYLFYKNNTIVYTFK